MDVIQVGDRVRVRARRLVHHQKVGTVVALSPTGGCYVHLDDDHDLPAARVFFHSEEVELASAAPVRLPGGWADRHHDDVKDEP
jgi:hypothetical protein